MCGATTKCCVSDFEPLVKCGDACALDGGLWCCDATGCRPVQGLSLC